MAIYKIEYCQTCKKTVTSNNGICRKCGSKVLFRGYGVRVRYFDDDGREKQKALGKFKTQREAKEVEISFRATHITKKPNYYSKPYYITLDELYLRYYEYQKSRVKQSTLYEIENVYRRKIKPFFGHYAIIDIDKRRLLVWQSKIESGNYKYNTKCKFRNQFHSILKYAVLFHDLPQNPIDLIPPFKNMETPKEMQIWTPYEFNQFASVIDDLQYKTFFTFLYYTGCRKGEALALNWTDIDFKNEIIKINKNLTRKIKEEKFLVTSTKNFSSTRNIRISENLLNVLEMYYQTTDKNGFVFGGNKPLPQTSIDRKLKYYCEISNVKNIRLHDFRHSHASYLISQGVDIVSVAKRLGHKDIEQTLNTYAHVLNDNEKSTMDALNKI